jgi:glycosyltransferase involved in cell wall biosynthesis
MNCNPNVLIIITGLEPDGAENMLLKILKIIKHSRCSFTVVSLSAGGIVGEALRAEGIPVINLDMKGFLKFIINICKLYALIKDINPNVVHTWLYHADLIGGFVAKICGVKKIIWSIRHSNLNLIDNNKSTLMIAYACAILSRWIPDEIISCSKNAATNHVNIGYKENIINVIPNGIDFGTFQVSDQYRFEIRSAYGISNNEICIGMMGRFDRQKNHLGFVEMSALLVNDLSIKFILVGSGVDWDNKVLTDRIVSLGLQDRYLLLGHRNDVHKIYNALDIYISTSKGEAFSNALAEAMACGLPSIVTNVGDSKYIIGESGFAIDEFDSVDFADKANILISDYLLRMKKSTIAIDRVHSLFDIKIIANLYLLSYLDCPA